jgi:hypothetical protein
MMTLAQQEETNGICSPRSLMGPYLNWTRMSSSSRSDQETNALLAGPSLVGSAVVTPDSFVPFLVLGQGCYQEQSNLKSSKPAAAFDEAVLLQSWKVSDLVGCFHIAVPPYCAVVSLSSTQSMKEPSPQDAAWIHAPS